MEIKKILNVFLGIGCFILAALPVATPVKADINIYHFVATPVGIWSIDPSEFSFDYHDVNGNGIFDFWPFSIGSDGKPTGAVSGHDCEPYFSFSGVTFYKNWSGYEQTYTILLAAPEYGYGGITPVPPVSGNGGEYWVFGNVPPYPETPRFDDGDVRAWTYEQFQVGTVVPLPGSWLLLGTGLLGLAAWRRRRSPPGP